MNRLVNRHSELIQAATSLLDAGLGKAPAPIEFPYRHFTAKIIIRLQPAEPEPEKLPDNILQFPTQNSQ